MVDSSELLGSVCIWILICTLIAGMKSCDTTVESQQEESKDDVKKVEVEQSNLQAKWHVRSPKIIPAHQYM